MNEPRSGCPINQSVEVLGDRWSLIVMRAIMFGHFRTYGELHSHSLEGIATNILADRMKRLVEEGLLSVAPDFAHKQRTIYSLTEKAIDLVPVMVSLGNWGVKHLTPFPALAARLARPVSRVPPARAARPVPQVLAGLPAPAAPLVRAALRAHLGLQPRGQRPRRRCLR